MLMIFGFGVKESLIATLVFVCTTCGNNAPHRLVKRVRRLSLFFVPVFSFGATYLDECTACGRVVDVPKEQAESAARQGGADLR